MTTATGWRRVASPPRGGGWCRAIVVVVVSGAASAGGSHRVGTAQPMWVRSSSNQASASASDWPASRRISS